ncbi:SusC/RagA family TonB-linked outer membrane protein [Sinomicrobium soli]|uniref:SusC/RagA family TonB-linked outer membrane protein n=1 Tax=Sinomicrobium sp. N-1-3-6 TaxID=2219864 RepID=UPI000DCEE813|nr:SusC/RagA family TonB-linked outer membrane protein [Sinomicrobium sp. N-1-3-6]RAV30837.1 SusC/RagA family TonB-linked outer membrane protein [Sinomicrobium sp. N-1-3-6]
MRTKISLILTLFLTLTVHYLSYAQEKTVSGTVNDASGLPLPGANVLVKGTTTGTQTDFDGNFTLTASQGQTLVISYIGMKTQEVQIGASSNITVTLEEDAESLEEVVVTALGITREKKSLGYATQEVGGDEVNTAKETNFVNSLSGKVAGLDIKKSSTLGGSSNVILRGYSSLTGNNQALFVIDGTPISNSNTNTDNQMSGRGGYDYGNAAMDVNPEDIESINVLKGAAATALYGSRAANGAIIITTKKGKTQKGIGVTINSGITFGSYDKDTFSKYQKEYGAGYGKYYGDDEASYFNDFDVNGDGVKDLVTPFGEDASFGGRFDPNLMIYQWDAFYPESPNYMKATPWVGAKHGPEYIFQTSTTFTNSVSLSGGNEDGSFRMGYTNLDQEGLLPNSKLKRNSIDFNGSYNFTDKLTASAKATFTKTDGKGREGTGYSGRNLMQSMLQWNQSNVDFKDQRDAYFATRRNITWNYASINPDDPLYLFPLYTDNPYWERYENYQNDTRNRLFGNISLDYEINDWISATARVSLDTYSDLREERIAVGSKDVSEYQRYNGNYTELNYDLLLNFRKDFSEKFNFNGTLGATKRTLSQDYITAQTNGGLVIPRLYSLSNSVNLLEPPLEERSELVADGYFTSLSFGYNDLLFLDLTGRIDKSSTLPTDDNTYFYPSASTAFVFSNLIDSEWLTFGKFRANYAEVGNYAPPLSVYTVFDAPTNFKVPMFSYATYVNNNVLKNETTTSLELGLEMAFFQRRLGFDFAAYKNNSKDQIQPIRVSDASGASYKWVNSGEIENKGLEVNLYGSPIRTEDFEWKVNINWYKNQSEVLSLYEGVNNYEMASYQGGVSINATVGEQYGSIWGSNFVYLDGERVVDPETGAYLVDTAAQPIGNINPDWKGGIQNMLRYKNLSLGFLIDVQRGGDIFSLDSWYGYSTGIFPETAGLNDLGNPKRDPIVQNDDGSYAANSGGIILPGVNPDGSPNTTRGSMEDSNNVLGYNAAGTGGPNAAHMYDASYIKLREVTLSYSLPSKIIDQLPFQNVTLSAVGRNLWIIDKNTPYTDPEAGLSSGNWQGIQSGPMPTAKEYGFNIRLQF